MSTGRNAGPSSLDPSLRKLLFLLVEDRISRGDGDEILPKCKNHRGIPVLRSLGYFQGADRLTDKAFGDFFRTFDTITCPIEIQRCIDRLQVRDVRWRRAKGVILDRIRRAHGYGMSFPLALTVFIRDGAELNTWYHELGHIIFPSVEHDKTKVAGLVAAAKELSPVRSAAEIKDAPGIAAGSYILIDGRYLGIDHSGTDAVEDEIWAIAFERYHCGSPLPPNLTLVIEEVLRTLVESGPTGQ